MKQRYREPVANISRTYRELVKALNLFRQDGNIGYQELLTQDTPIKVGITRQIETRHKAGSSGSSRTLFPIHTLIPQPDSLMPPCSFASLR